MITKLNLGCGEFKKEGFINVDFFSVSEPDIRYDLTKFPYPFEDNIFTVIEVDHLLEHLDNPLRVMKELHRIGKNDCLVQIRVPHFSRALAHSEHKRGFDVSLPLYFNPSFKGGYQGVHLELVKMRLRWFAQPYLKKTVLPRLLYHLGLFLGTLFDIPANLSPYACSRIWCFWVGGFEEIEFVFKVKKKRTYSNIKQNIHRKNPTLNMNLSNKKTFIILFAILTLSFITNITTFKSGHNWNYIDFIDYIYQAQNLVNGTFDEIASMNEYLMENSTRYMGGLINPWGFPILLSPVYYFFGVDIFAMKVLVSLFFVLSLFIVFLLFRERLSNIQNLLLVSIFAFNPWFFDFKDNVLSDIPFLFFSSFSLLLIQRFVISKKIWISKFVSYSLIGILIFFSYQVRAVGLILLPLLLAAQYIESRSSSSGKFALLSDRYIVVPYMVFIVSTFIFMIALPKGAMSSYVDLLSNKDFSKVMFDISYLALVPSRFFPFLFLKMNVYGFSYNKFSLVLYGLILFFVIFAMVRNRKTDYLYLLYMLFTIIVIFIFSHRQGFRLLIPISPFLLYFLFVGLSKVSLSFTVSDKNDPLKINAVYLFSIGMILISVLYLANTAYQNIAINRSNIIDGPFSNDSTDLFNYIKQNTKKDDAIMSYNPTAIILFTGRKSFALNKHKFKFDHLFDSHAEYFAYNKNDNPYKLTSKDLRDNFNCPHENTTFIFCFLKNNAKQQKMQK